MKEKSVLKPTIYQNENHQNRKMKKRKKKIDPKNCFRAVNNEFERARQHIH